MTLGGSWTKRKVRREDDCILDRIATEFAENVQPSRA